VGNDGKKVKVFPLGNMVYESKDGRVFFAERVKGKFVWAESELDRDGEESKREKWYELTYDRYRARDYNIADEDDGSDEWLDQAVQNDEVVIERAKAIRLFKAANRAEADEQIAEFLNVAQRRADGDNSIPPNIVRLRAVSVQEGVEYHGNYDLINQPMFAIREITKYTWWHCSANDEWESGNCVVNYQSTWQMMNFGRKSLVKIVMRKE